MTSILSFDPGRTTGWCLASLPQNEPLQLIGYGQIQNGLEGFVEFMATWDAPYADVIVSESFVDYGQTEIPNTVALKIEGAMRVIFGRRVHWQRSAKKAHASDAFLKEYGLWLTGQQHARDAVRHIIAFAKTNARHRPSIEYFWPERKEAA